MEFLDFLKRPLNRLAILWVASSLFCGVTALAQQPADTILYNGKVLTVDRSFTVAEAVAVRDGKIAAVGKNDEVLKLAGPNTMRLDLKGKTVAPGLVHSHLHVDGAAGSYGGEIGAAKLHEYPLNWKGVKSKDDVVRQIQEIMAAFKFKPGEWVYFNTINTVSEHTKIIFDDLNRWELDKAAPQNPIVVTLGIPAENGYIVNSKVIDALWAKYGDFVKKFGRYWVDASGTPDGHLEPPASRLIKLFVSHPDPEDLASLYRKGLEELSARGVTTVSTRLDPTSIETYQLLDKRGELPVRLAYGLEAAFGNPDFSMKGIKIGEGSNGVWLNSVTASGIDGAGARMCIDLPRDAAAAAESEQGSLMGLAAVASWWPRGQCHMDIEYSGGTRGARLSGNYYADWYRQVAQEGLRSANTHVSGDGSYTRLLNVMEQMDQIKPGSVKGWAMDHCTMIKPADVPRAARLGIMASCEPLGEGGRATAIGQAFGKNIANTYVAPIKTMMDAGINVSLEGDWPDVELLITRKDDKGNLWGPEQRLDRVAALRVATQNGANYVLKGSLIGSLEPGKLADIQILDRDYLTIPEEEISEIQPLLTMMGGKVIFVHSSLAKEYQLNIPGAIVGTYDELIKRRKRI